MSEPGPDERSAAGWSGIRAVFQFFRPYKSSFLWAAGALACAGILQLFFAYLSGNLVDGTLAHREEGADSGGWLAKIDTVGIAMISSLAGIVAFTYTEEVNGSAAQIAGILSENRRVLGMMPDPERAIDPEHPSQDGAQLFRSLAGALADA